MRIHKIKLILSLTILGMLFVSFKILEPEIANKTVDDIIKDAKIPDDQFDENLDVVFGHLKFELDINEPIYPNSSKEYIKDWLLQRYQVQWDKILDISPWNVAPTWVTDRQLVHGEASEIGAVLKEMATAPILKADVGFKGTQLKMSLTLQGGQRVVFKPKWFSRDHVIEGIYEGQDRHNGEIASFHLSRIMNFNKTPLVVGRTVDLMSEIKPVATRDLRNTFFTKEGNTCFYGRCMYCKSEKDGVCADGTKLEGAVVIWLPPAYSHFTYQRHPYQRTYKKGKKARWETDDTYCEHLKQISPYNTGPRLLDITAASIFDYLIGNADRHHYETFKNFTKTSILLMFDNGKSFGNPHHDEYSILSPIRQCCILRRNTWNRLQLLKDGVLSEVLREILAGDPIAPVLSEPHYTAMDRRLTKALETVQNCITAYGESKVLLDDGYS